MPRKPKKRGKTALGDNLYIIHGSYWFRFTYRGKTYTKRLGRVNELPLTSAKHIAGKLRTQIIENQYLEKEEVPLFSEVAEKYLEWYKTERVNASRRTIRETERRVKKLLETFGDKSLDYFSEFLIESYKQERLKEGVKPSTVNRELNILRAILHKAKEWGMYSGELPKIKTYRVDDERVRYLSPEELKALIDACPDWFKPVVKFACLTGLRASELFSLTWDMVNLSQGYITVPAKYSKTKETKSIPLHPKALEVLREVKAWQEKKGIDHGYVFTNRMGKPYSVEGQGYKRVFRSACKKAGIEDFRFHDLRHTFASYLVMRGVDFYTVQELMRHSSPKMTKRYAHLSPEHIRKELEKVREVF